MRAKLDLAIKQSINRQLAKDHTLINQTRIFVEKQFKMVLNQLISDFESHPLTQELKGGPGSGNKTGTLREGNVFGFIGFDAGYDPVQPIEERLKMTDIIIRKRSSSPKGFVATYSVNIPTLSELYSMTPLPWANGASWLQQIEGAGISGLGQYMHIESKFSRSGAGVQLKNLSSSGRLKIKYMKPLLRKFEKDLNNISGAQRI